LDLGQLEAFVQVAAHRSFSRAAESLQLTQPSVTARIQSLERELGEHLFERGGRGTSLTDAGAVFLPYAERILQTLRESREAIGDVRSLEAGNLRLGSALTVCTYVLPRILHSFHERYPRVEVSVRSGRSEQVLNMLLADEVQVGLVRSLVHPDVETVPLYEDEVILTANAAHPFARKDSVHIEDVAAQPVILFDRGSSYYALIHSLFRQAGVVPTVAMELDSMEATKRMVEEGLGIALLPRVCLQRELALGELVEVTISDAPAVSRKIALIYRRGRRRARTVQAFLEVLESIYRVRVPA
jgi:DNA-binding transcriptional LysR family regulator